MTTMQEEEKSLPRLLPPLGEAKAPEGLREHIARFGRAPEPRDLVALAEESGLTGRGGAAFPVYRKLAAVKDGNRRPVVIANGAETEPVSDKDATLLWLAPHLVLDGLQMVAHAIGANRVILYVHAHRRGDVGVALTRAITERSRGLDAVGIEVVEAPPRFLAGQETALINHLGGGPAVPTFPVPRITERGLAGAPTLVQNAETLAHLALIARYGARWFRAVGTRTEPGSMLCTIRQADGKPKVIEVPLGIPLRDLTGTGHSAVLVGGYHGTWIPAEQTKGLTLDNRSLAKLDARVGAGIIVSLPENRCGLAETARVVRYLALESAGQCGPCLNGLPRIATAMAELAGPRPRRKTREDVERWCGLVTGRGACHHPDGTARLVRSALVTFAAELDKHARGTCSATSRDRFLPVPSGAPAREEDWT
jgi:NADH:ubiquinone oxidoreductase subunit F (NADH-binding)